MKETVDKLVRRANNQKWRKVRNGAKLRDKSEAEFIIEVVEFYEQVKKINLDLKEEDKDK